MSTAALGALAGGLVCLAAAPYLARLTATVPDRDASRWWRGARVDARTKLATAVLAAALGTLAGAAAGWTALLPAFLVLALAGAPLVVIDVRVHRLPDRLVQPAAVAGAVLLTAAAAYRDTWTPLARAAEGGAAVLVILALLAYASPRSFGFGDVKLGALLGGYLGWFGWIYVYYGIFGGFLLGALLAVGLLVTRRATMKTAIPFGPMLIVGALTVLALDLTP